jgi:hypothetical protein
MPAKLDVWMGGCVAVAVAFSVSLLCHSICFRFVCCCVFVFVVYNCNIVCSVANIVYHLVYSYSHRLPSIHT